MVVTNYIYRMFDGKQYKWDKNSGYWPTKTQAQASADFWEKAGFLVSVTAYKDGFVRWIGPSKEPKTVRKEMSHQWTDTDHKINAILEKNPEAWCANCAHSRKGRTFNGTLQYYCKKGNAQIPLWLCVDYQELVE